MASLVSISMLNQMKTNPTHHLRDELTELDFSDILAWFLAVLSVIDLGAGVYFIVIAFTSETFFGNFYIGFIAILFGTWVLYESINQLMGNESVLTQLAYDALADKLSLKAVISEFRASRGLTTA